MQVHVPQISTLHIQGETRRDETAGKSHFWENKLIPLPVHPSLLSLGVQRTLPTLTPGWLGAQKFCAFSGQARAQTLCFEQQMCRVEKGGICQRQRHSKDKYSQESEVGTHPTCRARETLVDEKKEECGL